MAGENAHRMGCALIAKGDRNGPMDRERRRSKGDPKLLQCLGPFMTAMRHGHEIGHGEMALAVARVWSGRDSGGIGRPHCRSRPGGGPPMRFGFLNSGSQLCKPDAIGPIMGEEKTLGQDRKSVVSGKSVSGRVALGGRRTFNKQKRYNQ